MSSHLGEEEEEEQGSGWIVSYADLMTLLFAAFVVLYGITPQGKSQEILGITSSIREAFIEIPDEIPEKIRRAERFQGKLSFEKAIRDSTINPAIKKFNRQQNILPDKTRELQELEMEIKNLVQGDGLSRSLRNATQFDSDEYGFHLKLIDKVFFPRGKTTPTNEGTKLIKMIAEKMKKNRLKIYIDGHSEVRNLGSYTPLELSALRASATRSIFIDSGIDKKRLFIAGYGNMRPIDRKESLKNNRVEIKVKYFERAIDGRGR